MSHPTPRDKLQAALDAWWESGRSIEKGAERAGLKYSTFKHRVRLAHDAGLKPLQTAAPDDGRPRVRVAASGKPIRVLAIGDAHDSPRLDKDRFRWMGRHAGETRPDWIVQIGDFFTLDSLNSHESNASFAGKAKPAYLADIASANEALDAFNSSLPKGYHPRKHITLGNHENRVWKWANEAPETVGMMEVELTSVLESHGWAWSKYGEFFFLGGVGFVHVPLNRMGKPYGGKTAEQQIANDSCWDVVAGHSHVARQWRAPKIGPAQHVTVLNLGCALPDGVVEEYAQMATTGWTWGVYDLSIGGGHILSASFIPMTELERRYGR